MSNWNLEGYQDASRGPHPIHLNMDNGPLQPCSMNPLTGYTRTGFCESVKGDEGSHHVCAKMDRNFLDFTARKGNDLSSVVRRGQNWCLCQDRWLEAYDHGYAPTVIRNATNQHLKKTVRGAINGLTENNRSPTKRHYGYH